MSYVIGRLARDVFPRGSVDLHEYVCFIQGPFSIPYETLQWEWVKEPLSATIFGDEPDIIQLESNFLRTYLDRGYGERATTASSLIVSNMKILTLDEAMMLRVLES